METVDLAAVAATLAASGERNKASLRLSKEPRQKWWPNKHRDIEEIEKQFRSELRRLVTGLDPWPLYLWGNPGTGKTCAVLALCDHCHGSWFMTTDALTLEWNGIVCNGIDADDNHATPLGYRKRMQSVPLLVLDDCGTREKASPSAYEVFKAALDLREGKPLIVTSNHPLEMMAQLYDERIKDRFEAGTVIELAGKSRRQGGS